MKRLAHWISAAGILLSLNLSAPAQNCQNTSIGATPINDLGSGTYMGFQGGLYPGGSNLRPPAHRAAGLEQAALVVPRDAAGQPAPDGRIVFLSIGMSNTRSHWQSFTGLANQQDELNPRLTLVQGAQGGQAAEVISDPDAPYWNFVQNAVQQAGATNQQVQVIWLLEANAGPDGAFPQHALELRGDYVAILQIVRDLFPHARLAYLGSRIYAGYATTPLNPEPYAYEQGFTVKWTIEQQINGFPGLNFDPGQGPVRAPWLSWGTYNWADGLVPRSDGLTWVCPDDFASDGTHPSAQGSAKVAGLMLEFFRNDPTAAPWFLGTPDNETGTGYCAGDGSGTPCPCLNQGAPGRGCRNSAFPGGTLLAGQGIPSVGDDTVVLSALGMPSGATVLFFQGAQPLNGGDGFPFGDGLRCAGVGVIRLAILPVPGAAAQFPGPGDPPLSEAGLLPPFGGVRFYQAWYRDPAPGFCTPATFNFSNGFRIEWAP